MTNKLLITCGCGFSEVKVASVGVYAAINLLKSSIHSLYSHGSIKVAKGRMKRCDAQPAAAPAVDGAKSITAGLNQSRDEGFLYQEARTISTEVCRSGLRSRKRVDRIRKTSCVWPLSRKQMSKTHTRTHIHTIRNNNRRRKNKKHCTDFLKSHLSVSASESVRVCT